MYFFNEKLKLITNNFKTIAVSILILILLSNFQGIKRKAEEIDSDVAIKKSALGDLGEDYASGEDEYYYDDGPQYDRSRSCPYLDTINRLFFCLYC